MCTVYILKSKKDKKLYIGCSRDISERIKAHNNGRVRATKARRPLEVIRIEKYESITLARQRENFLKSGHGRKWIKEEVLSRRSG